MAPQGRRERLEAGELASDVNGNALDVEARQAGGCRVGVKRVADRYPEFILGGAGCDLRVRAGRHIRVHTKADRRCCTHR